MIAKTTIQRLLLGSISFRLMYTYTLARLCLFDIQLSRDPRQECYFCAEYVFDKIQSPMLYSILGYDHNWIHERRQPTASS